MLLQENTIFDKRYQLIRLLGRGGFSEVWLAKDSYTKLDIALKVYAPGQGMDSDGLTEFSAELAGVFNLNHTNLLKPTHVDAWEGMPYLIMPFCSRGSIVKRVGKMQEDEIWKLIHDVASGLAYLHKNDIVHQDIKPDNILLDDNGNYVITDFGISTKARSTLRKSALGGAVSGGTMAYMGPERFSKQPAPTKASDIWSFGAMVYELITGNVPFGEMGGGMQKGGAEIPEINEPISDKLRQTIESMLALETWDRPTAEQLADGNINILKTEKTAPEVVHLPETSSRATQRFPLSIENQEKRESHDKNEIADGTDINKTSRNDRIDKNKKFKKIAIIAICIILLPILWMLYGLFSTGLYFSNTQVIVNCDANGLENYFGEVNIYEPLFGNKLSDWWWDIEDFESEFDIFVSDVPRWVSKTNGGYRLHVYPNNSSEDRVITFNLSPKFGKKQKVTINQEGKDVRLTASSTNLSFGAKGGKKFITINANIAWEVEHPTGEMYEVIRSGNKLTVNVSPNTSYQERSDYFNVKNLSGSRKIRIDLTQIGKPEAKIDKVWVDHNVSENGNKGMRIHFTMHAYNVKSKSCRAVAYFFTESGTALIDSNGSYRTTDGKVSCGEDFCPGYDHSLYEDFTMFMPYDELHVNHSGSFKFFINLWNNSVSPSEDLGESDWEHFTCTL